MTRVSSRDRSLVDDGVSRDGFSSAQFPSTSSRRFAATSLGVGARTSSTSGPIVGPGSDDDLPTLSGVPRGPYDPGNSQSAPLARYYRR
jgi:hypothetical protein